MPFKKTGKDDYVSPSGRHFNGAQVRLYYANGGKFPGEKEHSMNKGYQGKVESFAEGGAVLGRTRDFMKEPDRFRQSGADGRFVPKPETTEDVWGKGSSAANPAAKDKSLPAVKPKK